MDDVDCEESMAAGRKSPKDQPPDANASQNSPQDRLPDATKFSRPIQVIAQIVIAALSLGTTALMQRSWYAALTAVAVIFLLLSLGQLFFKSDIAPVIAKIFNRASWIAFAVILAFAAVRIILVVKSGPGSDPPLAERTLRELNKDLYRLRAEYQNLPYSVTKAADVNMRAAILAGNISDLNDADFNLGMQVFKYESLAYANGIVAGSEMIAGKQFTDQDKLTSIKALLEASEKAQKLIEEVRRPQHADDRLQKLRTWLRDDDADPRLQRFTAVGLCFRWQVTKNPKDRTEARDLVNTLPAYYKAREHPEQSPELAECVKSN
jgi:hypothetical protein